MVATIACRRLIHATALGGTVWVAAGWNVWSAAIGDASFVRRLWRQPRHGHCRLARSRGSNGAKLATAAHHTGSPGTGISACRPLGPANKTNTPEFAAGPESDNRLFGWTRSPVD